MATVTGEAVSAQTVSRLTRDLDEAVQQFHHAPLKGEWAYLFLDGMNLKVHRPAGRQCVQMLIAYGVRKDKARQLLGFCELGARAGSTGNLCCRISIGAARKATSCC